MTLAAILFVMTLIMVCALVAWRGGFDERMAAAAITLASFLSPLVSVNGYVGIELGVVIVDAGLFFALAAISLRSRAFWPMWAAGFQLCALAGHLAAAKSHAMVPAAYAETLAIWSYAVILTLLLGTLFESGVRHGRR